MDTSDGGPLPGSPADWKRHARSDVALAKLGEESDEVLAAQVCFHAQQAIEKILKGLLVYIGRSYPAVHDLEQLLERLREANATMPDWIDEVLEVTPYATEGRYPGYWEPITADDQRDAIALAEKTLAWAEDLMAA